MRKPKLKKPKCRFPGCQNTPVTRENCPTHYRAVAQMVHRKQTTWEEQERCGRVGPANQQRGRKPVVRDYYLKGVKP